MKSTYNEAMVEVFLDEGGYSNDAGDPGGPTNWGITLADARSYWKSNATADDVRSMPKSVAQDIYDKHYATPLQYNSLPAGVDYAVLDYGINSGISRSAQVLQNLCAVSADGKIGPLTLAAVAKKDPKGLINAIYDERLKFLQGLNTFSRFGFGWTDRCRRGRVLALAMVDRYKPSPTAAGKGTTAVVVATGIGSTIAAAPHNYMLWGILGSIVVAFAIGYVVYRIRNRTITNVANA